MANRTISTHSGEHYKWGGPQGTDCDGWHLVKTPQLSIIEELIPPRASEVRHSHARARQFFYVLEGEFPSKSTYMTISSVPAKHSKSPGKAHEAMTKLPYCR